MRAAFSKKDTKKSVEFSKVSGIYVLLLFLKLTCFFKIILIPIISISI